MSDPSNAVYLPVDGGPVIKIGSSCYQRDTEVEVEPDLVTVDEFHPDCSNCLTGGSAIPGPDKRYIYVLCRKPPDEEKQEDPSSTGAGSVIPFCTEEMQDQIHALSGAEYPCETILQKAVEDLSTGPQTALYTWSMVPSGVKIFDVDGANPGSGTATIDWEQGAFTENDGVMVPALAFSDFQSMVASAFAEWKTMLEKVFSPANGYPNQLTVTFTYSGVEAGSPPALRQQNFLGQDILYDIPSGLNPLDQNNPYIRVGVFRIFRTKGENFAFLGRTNPPFSAEDPSSYGSRAKDLEVNGLYNFRKQSTTPKQGEAFMQAYDLKHVAVHELGHAFGFSHWDPMSVIDVDTALELTQASPEIVPFIKQGYIDHAAGNQTTIKTYVQRVLSVMSEGALGSLYNFDAASGLGGKYTLYPSSWPENRVDQCMIEAKYGGRC